MFDPKIAHHRAHLTQKIRNFFNDQGFLEVENPILTPIPGMEPHLNVFETTYTSPQNESHPLYLNTSPELQMKKLLAQPGFEKIYNITKVFRNGEHGGGRHNPEFTMLEWYRLDADYKDLMTDCENLTAALTDNHPPPWPRKSVHELFLEYTKIDLLKNQDYKTFKKTAQIHNHTTTCETWDDIFFKIFLNDIEPHLGKDKPIFVYDYPATQAALAKKSTTNPFWAERFELYIASQELANAFSELIDPTEQRQRLEEEQQLRRQMNKTVFPIDEDFLQALESITKPAAGIALGLDRLFMVLLEKETIEEVLLFPFSKLTQNGHHN